MNTELNNESYEYWMRLERHYEGLERSWEKENNATWAGRCNKLRFRCMELALDSLVKGFVENRKVYGPLAKEA
jgi:hypothetical protein